MRASTDLVFGNAAFRTGLSFGRPGGGPAYDPASLFANGEQGAWYDPSDLSTVFQVAAGTIPSLPGDPVGLVLDKRLGLVLGPDLMAQSGWQSTTTPAWDVSVPGQASIISAAAQADLLPAENSGYNFTPTVMGRRYLIEFDYEVSAGVLLIFPLSGTPSLSLTGSGTYRSRAIATAKTFLIRAATGATATVTNWRVRDLPGNHVSQPTAAARPTLLDISGDLVLRFDLADDALTTTLPQAINGDILIAGTNGSIIEPVSYAASSTFALGPDTYTGGTPGILSAIGDIVGVLLIDKTLSQVERDNLIAYYKKNGAKGLLVPGPELVANSGNPFTETTGWTTLNSSLSVEDGALRVTKTNTNGQARSSITSSSGGVYKYKATLKGRTTESSVYFQLGPTSGAIAILNRVLAISSDPVVSPITIEGIVASPGSSIHISLYSALSTGQYDDWSEVSIRELRPQEDW